jgi:Sigma-70 region 2
VNPLTNVPVPPDAAADPAEQVTALYQAHALGLLRLAVIMLGERQAAEDAVQDAFLGLFRRWDALNDPERALAYVRSSVFNGCRTVLRRRGRNRQFALVERPYAESADARLLLGEEHREVLAALRRLPDRQLPKTPPVGATLDALTTPAPWTGCAAPTDTAYPGFAAISLAGDRLARVLYQVRPACMGAGRATVLWSSPSGDTVLGAVSYTDDPSMTEHSAVVLYRHGTVTTISWPGAVSLLLANETAF